jgi:hypothetical protein
MRSSPMRSPRGALSCAAAPELNPQPGRARPCVMRDRISDTTENPRFLEDASGARPCRKRSRAAPRSHTDRIPDLHDPPGSLTMCAWSHPGLPRHRPNLT